MTNKIYYGDNLDVLRRYIKDETVDLCYIDPPFNSKRNYNQIYNNVGKEDKAQAQAFTDTWEWDDCANQGLLEIQSNYNGVFTAQSIDLINGLEKVLKRGALLAYLVSMTLRIAEIHRVLKPTGSFYFHCDPTASHYLKLVLDAVFCTRGGDFKNEIIWKRAETVKGNFGQGSQRFDCNTDTIFFYSKSDKSQFHPVFNDYSEKYVKDFYKYVEPETGRRYQLISMTAPGEAAKGNPIYEVMGVKRYWRYSKEKMDELIKNNLVVQTKDGNVPRRKQYLDEGKGVPIQSLWDDVPALHSQSAERLGYPTQKPEALLERIIQASSNEGDVVLDAYCGCGTTVAVANKLNRQWIGIDITYQSISLILKRLEEQQKDALNQVEINGVPKDFNSAVALANKADDRTRKEFEKWAVLTYSKNQAMINEKKGGDKGVDGVAFILDRENPSDSKTITNKVVFQVKSNQKLSPTVVRDLIGTMQNEGAVCGVLLTLYPMPNLVKESKLSGLYRNNFNGNDYSKITVVSAEELLAGERMNLPNPSAVLKQATQHAAQSDLF